MENEEDLNKNDIEIVSRHIRKEEEFKRKLEKNQFKAMTTFKKIKNLYSDGIVPKIKHHKRVVGNSLKDLMGDDADELNRINLKKRKELRELQASKSHNNQSHMSDNAKYLSEKIKFQVSKIRKAHDDITGLNALYLDHKTVTGEEINNKTNNRYDNANNNVDNNDNANNNNDNKNNNNDENKNDNDKNNDDNKNNNDKNNDDKKNDEENNNNDDKNKDDKNKDDKKNKEKEEEIPNYLEAIRKKKIRNNFEYMANKYHKQLINAFGKYYPDKYLNNLKLLIQVSPTLRDEISNIKKEVEGDIKDITDKRRLHKKYHEFLRRNMKSRSTLNLDPKLYKSDEIIKKSNTTKNRGIGNIDKTIILPNIGKEKISVNIKNRNNVIKIGKVRRLTRRDSKKLMDIRELQFDHMNRLHNISQEIQNYIGKDNIDEKINNCLQDFKLQKSINLYKDKSEIQESITKQKNYYAKQDKKINDLFGDLYINRLQAIVQERERKFTDKLRINNYDYFHKIRNDMITSLNDFDINIHLNKVYLKDDNKPSDSDVIIF